MKLMVCIRICFRFGASAVRIDAPAILARYTGTSGKTQGDKKDRIPAARAAGKVMFGMCLFLLRSIAITPWI